MKLAKTSITKWERNFPENPLFSLKHTAEIKEIIGSLDYKGPKIPPEEWRKVLSFFKWTYDKDKSESQVRAFVSTVHNSWRFYAFPQKAGTGMTTKELDTDDSKKQRAELFGADDDNWTAWGTVHHHCGCSAFQSGTDENDEKDVGGLHITIGNLNDARYSLHARLYHQGDMYEPDMSSFWDIGTAFSNVPDEILRMLPADAKDRLAREQMCVPSADEFPQIWKDNYITVTHTPSKEYGSYKWPESDYDSQIKLEWGDHRLNQCVDGSLRFIQGAWWVKKKGVWRKWQNGGTYNTSETDPKKTVNGKKEPKITRRNKDKGGILPVAQRAQLAWEYVIQDSGYFSAEKVDVVRELVLLEQSEVSLIIIDACKNYEVTPNDLLDIYKKELQAESKTEEKKESNPLKLVNDDEEMARSMY